MKEDRTEPFYAALSKALNGYLADKFGLGIADVNERTVRNELGAHAEGPQLADDYVELIRACEMARYAPIEGSPRRELYDRSVELIGNIERMTRS